MEDLPIDELANLPMPKEKKTVNRVLLNEQTLLQENKGLKKLYLEAQKIKMSGDVKNDLKKLLNLYKEWHFGAAPRFEFNYFVQKCQTLGTKAPIRSFMSRIRRVHAGQLTWKDIENPVDLLDNNENFEENFGEDEKVVEETNYVNNGDTAKNEIENLEEIEYFEEMNGEDNQDELDFMETLAMEYTEAPKRKGTESDEGEKKLKISMDI